LRHSGNEEELLLCARLSMLPLRLSSSNASFELSAIANALQTKLKKMLKIF
jgi:hypothetical protein